MYQDSGLFLRGGSGVGFAARRMERRAEEGVPVPSAWRTPHGAVLRLLPDRLAALAAEVRSAVPPSHSAAADPHAAVREHVGALARAARPAGTVLDRATGGTLHVFRAPGIAGEMAIVTAPPSGPVFDVVAVRPAAEVQGELEVRGLPGYSDGGARARGPRANITWSRWTFSDFLEGLKDRDANVLHARGAVYVITWLSDEGGMQIEGGELPRYVGETANVRDRFASYDVLLKTFGVDASGFAIWLGTLTPYNDLRYDGVYDAADQEKLLRKDVEHVLIRYICEIQGYPLTNINSTGPVWSGPKQDILLTQTINRQQRGVQLPQFLLSNLDEPAAREHNMLWWQAGTEF